LNGGFQLSSIADEPGITEQFFDSFCGKSCDDRRVKIMKCRAVRRPLPEYAFPAEPGLGAFQYQKLKESPVVVHRTSPFMIMVFGQ
jgi:hypothetical protein